LSLKTKFRNKKANKSISTNTKAASNTANKKRKTYKKGKKYAFYLQAVQSTEQCRDSKYPCIQVSHHKSKIFLFLNIFFRFLKFSNKRTFLCGTTHLK
jgi:hypothetical protein